MRFIAFCLLFVLCCCAAANAQTDTLPANNDTSLNATLAKLVPRSSPDSIAKVKRAQFIADSTAMAFLAPNPLRENQFKMGFPKIFFSAGGLVSASPSKLKNTMRYGDIRNSRDPWVIITVLALLVYTALLNRFLNRDVYSIIQSFSNKRTISKAEKETGLISSWAFAGFFLLFSLSFGLVLYQVAVYYNTEYDVSGFNLFILLTLMVSALLLVKLVALTFLGFIFDIRRQVGRYMAILNLTYFNIAFVFLAAAACFSLIDNRLIPSLLIFTLLLIAIVFVWQFFRNSLNIISDFRFHKFYLFIYLCALEICPILILIKALNI